MSWLVSIGILVLFVIVVIIAMAVLDAVWSSNDWE